MRDDGASGWIFIERKVTAGFAYVVELGLSVECVWRSSRSPRSTAGRLRRPVLEQSGGGDGADEVAASWMLTLL
jgi:hypothetical protein